MSKRLVPSIALAAAVTAAAGLPAAASAAPAAAAPGPIFPPAPACQSVEAPAQGAVKFFISPAKVKQGTQPRLKYLIYNAGKTCLGVSAAPYGLQISGFAGWSNIPWDTGIIPQYIRYLAPGGVVTGTTAPLPPNLGAGGYYRVIPKFSPDAPQPVAGALLTIV